MRKLATILLVVSGLAACTAYAQTNSPACNDHLIVGTYSFTVEGEKLAGPPWNAYRSNERCCYDNLQRRR